MKLTSHGRERIQSRTQMRVRDVKKILENDAVVVLGSDHRREYLLFYSPPDDGCKIALVTKEREQLISIWEVRFLLPRGVKRVTNALAREARKAFYDYVHQVQYSYAA